MTLNYGLSEYYKCLSLVVGNKAIAPQSNHNSLLRKGGREIHLIKKKPELSISVYVYIPYEERECIPDLIENSDEFIYEHESQEEVEIYD